MSSVYEVMDSIITEKSGKEDWTFDDALALEHEENPMESNT